MQEMLHAVERPQLVQMLAWKIGLEHDFSVSIGKAGKYLRRFLTQADWNAFLSTYASGALAEMWLQRLACAAYSTAQRAKWLKSCIIPTMSRRPKIASNTFFMCRGFQRVYLPLMICKK